MNNKQLNKFEINQIFRFIEKKGIKWYDIQLEIVDHFASELEQNWEQYAHRATFERKLLDVYYNKIGKGGLHAMQLAKGKAFEKWFNAHCINYVKSFFTWPKIVVSLFLFILVYALINSTSHPIAYGERLIKFTLLLPCLFASTISFFWQLIGKKYKYSNLLILSIMCVCAAGGFIPTTLNIINWLPLSSTAHIITLSIAFVVFLYFVIAFLQAFIKCYKDYNSQYPKLT